MEMERINENTIRVLIGNDDLTQRGITVLDLLGNHKQIENFFYSVLEEVDVDHQFQETDAVTFQVLPNRNGLELFISKSSDEDEPDENQDSIESITQEEVPDFLKQQLMQRDDEEGLEPEEVPDEPTKRETPLHTVVLKLHSFEDMISIAVNTKLTDTPASLYFYQGHYYLELTFRINETSPESIKDELAVAYEYANKADVTVDVLEEHGQTIMAQTAMELTRRYFSK
ncbi:adaptor protein MecA [uncultured Secundilactobacillus sp.]|uniref:adaptor protein MecA n=1 Tax=uncultured Secundilactobacillus sp. TaxID=2813935 RepID=UPI0025896D97|nr:adaptor protein MecA [uncultured Secundilactobacillus sp.]